jgi:4-diphosphocytidyl-2-C-methyl-D-erythritol kinase
MKAARLLAERVEGLRTGAFRLMKRLPVAAGIGGGSSDAAAALRLLARLNGLPHGHPALAEAARLAGADVPVCLDPRARTMRGAGEDVGPPIRLPPLFAVLVNPRVPVETPRVFRALGLEPGASLQGQRHPLFRNDLSPAAALDLLREARNDLEPPAIGLEPAIGEALDLVRGTAGCRLARMSGSGATVFGLYETRDSAERAAGSLAMARPDWWIEATELR